MQFLVMAIRGVGMSKAVNSLTEFSRDGQQSLLEVIYDETDTK